MSSIVMEEERAEVRQSRQLALLGNLLITLRNFLGDSIFPHGIRAICVGQLLPDIKDLVENAVIDADDCEEIAKLNGILESLTEEIGDIGDEIPFRGDE